ncbi:MAG: hypothetical protein KGV50_02565 [Gammaproteobacteria bacterium]|nr:hypothetical protein [Gammaproteobacteria bacterium]
MELLKILSEAKLEIAACAKENPKQTPKELFDTVLQEHAQELNNVDWIYLSVLAKSLVLSKNHDTASRSDFLRLGSLAHCLSESRTTD